MTELIARPDALPAGEVIPVADLLARRAHLSTDDGAEQDDLATLLAGLSDNTKEAYWKDWTSFCRWCSSLGVDPLSVDVPLVLAYVEYQGGLHDGIQRLALTTLRRHYVAIRLFARGNGVPLPAPPAGEDRVQKKLQLVARKSTKSRRKARAISQSLLVRMVNATPQTLLGQRDRALLLVGYLGAFRRSELTGLTYDLLSWHDEGLAIHLPRSKGDQEGRGRDVYIRHTRHPETCGATQLKLWQRDSGRTTGHVFTAMNRWGHVSDTPLDSQMVSRIVKHYARLLGEDPKDYSAHSLRSGLATSAAKAGADMRTIMKQTGHARYDTLEGYIQSGTGFTDNVVAFLEEL